METKINISKFWTRVWALLIDSIVLGVIGLVLGLTIQDYLVSIGNSGLLFGLIITIAYLTICNSELASGQTIGKRIMDIHVVDINGDTIDVGKSFLRALILSFPYFTVNLAIPGLSDTSIVSIIKSLVLFSIVTGVVVIYIFNRQTRQSLHDLIVGTYVATTEENEDPVIIPTVTKPPFYIFGGLVMLFIGFAVYSTNWSTPELRNGLNVYTKVSAMDGVLSANISENTNYLNGSKTLTYGAKLWVKVLPVDNLEDSEMVRKTVQTILMSVPNINNFDVIAIVLNRGFNIGIASNNSTTTIINSPGKWREILQKKTNNE
jgi:uncharacterized RDD family membrane protein YckC